MPNHIHLIAVSKDINKPEASPVVRIYKGEIEDWERV
jgi:hypothetical protein